MSEPKLFSNLLLSVGAMKAGTTWLYAVLARHPALHFALEKELHYFYHRYVNADFLSEAYRLREARNRYLFRFDPDRANIDAVRANLHWVSSYLSRPVDDHWYRNLFQMRDHQIYACDFSNLNAQLPAEAWPQINARCGRLRVLFTMRDPLKRLWSHTKFHLQITGQLERLESWGPEDFEAFVRQPHIWENGEYGKILQNLQAGLPSDALKIICYEDLHADQRGQLRGIETFLGLPHHDYPQDVLDRRLTESVKHQMPPYFSALFADDIARICAEVDAAGYPVPAAWAAEAPVPA